MSSTEADPEDGGPEPGGHVEFARVRVGDRAYAVESGRVEQFVRDPTISRVPRSSPAVAGVTEVDGGVVAVIDGRTLFDADAPAGGDSGVLLVFAGIDGPHASGVLVDEVERIDASPVDRIRPAGDGEGPPGAGDDRPFAAVIDEVDAAADGGGSGGGDDADGTAVGVIDPEGLIEAARTYRERQP